MSNNSLKKPFTYASRDEVDCELRVLEGRVPKDLIGYVIFQSPCGTVNSGGLPIPEYLNGNGEINKEYGSPVFNGDAMLHRFDLSESGKVTLKTAMLKTPCFYADEATKIGTTYYDKGWQFRMLGIARTSFKFGSRNELNTAISPFQFKGDKHVRMTANFDMGRPWEIDLEKMKLITPIGSTKEWTEEMPKILDYPFQLFQATAHPSFDPVTKEFFTVNFTKTLKTMFFDREFHKHMMKSGETIEKRFEEFLHNLKEDLSPEHIEKEVHGFFENVENLFGGKSWWWKIWDKIHMFFHNLLNKWIRFDKKMKSETKMTNWVILLKWDGEKMTKWKVIDESTGKPIVIDQCMHQTNLTEDYLILCDTSFKFAIDIMESNPFPHHHFISRILRKLTSKAQNPNTPFYIIKRSDLVPSKHTVIAKQLVINLETVHFSADYKNPGGKITLHTAHNAANCAAEWIRPYDSLAVGDKDIYQNTVGLMSCGEMDIGRIGRFVIDGETAKIVDDKKLYTTGMNGNDTNNIGPHTWAVALHTYRDIISATKAVDKINQIYWQCYGLDRRYLTRFIEGLYRKYEHRISPVKEILDLNEKGVPYCLLRQDTNKMTIEDAYIFQMNENLRSMQFIPRGRDNTIPHADPETDGYIFCTMVVGPEDFDVNEYIREIWIFDAANLSSGPVCKLAHDDMNYAYTIHSAWIPECVSQQSNYKLNIREDFDYLIEGFIKEKDKEFYKGFMNDVVYPHFE